MMSVFKLHQALAVCDRLHGSGRSLNETVDIKAEDMALETYSPLKDRYPNGGITLSVAELTEYTLKKSDSIACDILFDRIVSPEVTDAFIREKAGIDGVKIRYNEAEMQADPMRAYENSTTPTAAVRLLERLWKNEILPEEQTAFIKKLMIECETGAAKLPAPLKETGAVIGHKTGSGYRLPDGRLTSCNDIGFVTLPDGRTYFIAVFIKDSALADAENDRLIADISAIAYRFFVSQNSKTAWSAAETDATAAR